MVVILLEYSYYYNSNLKKGYMFRELNHAKKKEE